ncbi:MAG: hypothetical protein JXM79_19490 [Sedimentisphaerales bacterium]|nr:hypothetical protein [Sedimentisphaerales bacterium]
MSRNKTIDINIGDIAKKNPNIDISDLQQNLEILGKLRENGVNTGPNYNLGSPYARPNPNKTKQGFNRSALHAGPPKKN